MSQFYECFTMRCARCRWLFQCHREHADRIYCRACEDKAYA